METKTTDTYVYWTDSRHVLRWHRYDLVMQILYDDTAWIGCYTEDGIFKRCITQDEAEDYVRYLFGLDVGSLAA